MGGWSGVSNRLVAGSGPIVHRNERPGSSYFDLRKTKAKSKVEASSGFGNRHRERATDSMHESTSELKPLTLILVTFPPTPTVSETSTLPPIDGLVLRTRS